MLHFKKVNGLTSIPFASRWLRVRWLLLPLLLTLVFALPQLFGGKMKVDSGLYAGVSLHAYNEGTFWTLMAGDQPYFRKPPLVFWIHGAFLWLAGPHLWALRLPSVLAGLGCVALTALIARLLSNRRVAMYAGCIMASTISFFHFYQRFILDYWLTFFALLGVSMIVASVRRDRTWLAIASGAPIGLSMLCKPLIAGIALPIAVVWLLTIRKPRLALTTAAGGTLIALAIAMPWHISMIAIHGDLFVGAYYQREMVDRVTNAQGFQVEPPFWYFLVLAQSYWPWNLTLALGLWTWLRVRPASQRERRFRRFCVVFCALWLGIMSCSADKRNRYLMPMMPMLAMIGASWIEFVLRERNRRALRRTTERWLDVAIPVACGGAAIFAALPLRYNSPGAPEWEALDQYIREHPDERYQIGTLNVQDGGRIYFHTGIWPHNRVDPLYRELPIPPGTLLLNSHEVPRTRRIRGEVVFDQGKLQIIRVQ